LPPRLRIATVNCLNMALPARRFYSGVDPYKPDEYIAKTQWLAGLLDRIAADFVLVQEIFHETALRDAGRQCSSGPHAHALAGPRARWRTTRTASPGLVSSGGRLGSRASRRSPIFRRVAPSPYRSAATMRAIRARCCWQPCHGVRMAQRLRC